MAKSGRPKAKIDWEEIANYAKLNGTLDDIVDLSGVSHRTLEDRCLSEKGMHIRSFLKQNRNTMKLSYRKRLHAKIESEQATDSVFLYGMKTVGGLMDAKDYRALELKERELELKSREIDAIGDTPQIQIISNSTTLDKIDID